MATPQYSNPTNDTLTGNGFNAAETVECASTPFDLWHPVAACLFKIKY